MCSRSTPSAFCTGLQTSKDLKREACDTPWTAVRNKPLLSEGEVNFWLVPTLLFLFSCCTSTQQTATRCCRSTAPAHAAAQTAARGPNTPRSADAWLEEALFSSHSPSELLRSPSEPNINIKYVDQSAGGPNSCCSVLSKTTRPLHKRVGVHTVRGLTRRSSFAKVTVLPG